MKEWRVAITNEAEAELDSIFIYIATLLLEPQIAEKQIIRIFNAILSLNHMPERHPLYEAEPWRSRGVRTFPVDNYVIFYHTVSATSEVFVDHIFYGGRSFDKLL